MKLLPHQIEAVNFLTSKKYAILADNMGLGKSLSAISSSIDCTNLLIIAPAYLKKNWERELLKWGFDRPHFICSYEYVASGKAEIYFQGASHIIVDECHYAKNIKSDRTKAIHEYVRKFNPKNVYLLSGTPAKNRVPELYSLLMICSYGNHETRKLMTPYYSYFSFCRRFSRSEIKIIRGRKIETFSGHNNLEELKRLMETCYLRRLKMEVDLPSMRDINIYLDLEDTELDDTDLKDYQSTGKISPALASRKAENALSKAPHTAKFCKGIIEAEEAEQIVIFCDHVKSVELMAKNLGVEPIHGSTSMEMRDTVVQNFINKKTKYLVTTIGTGSTGLNLVNTHVMVFNSFPWVSGDLEQAKKRTNRIGQDKDCIYYYMIAGDLDERILKTLNGKQKTLTEVL